MFPAGQSADFVNARLVNNVKGRATVTFTVGGAFDVHGLDFSSVRITLAAFANVRLG